MLCVAKGGSIFPGVPQPCLCLDAHYLPDVEDTFCLVFDGAVVEQAMTSYLVDSV